MSRWECKSGHLIEGLFFSLAQIGDEENFPPAIVCPICEADMILSREEGALQLLHQIREFVGKTSVQQEFSVDGSRAL